MSDFPVGLREVIPNQTVPEKCREFSINTGGAQSTLQDIKLPDCAGGFVFEDNGKLETRNRFIIWRTSHDVLELAETSLDWTLIGNRVRYRFQDTPILSGGVAIYESFGNVVVLVATVSSVHKMIFRHPSRIRREDHDGSSIRNAIPSVFAEATASTPRENCHIIPSAGTTPLPHAAATWLDSDDEALFALANPTGLITLIKLSNLKGIVTSNPLKLASYLGRLWGNIGGMLSRGAAAEGADAAMSLVIHPVQSDFYVFALCKDHKIRMWLASSCDCVMVADVLNMAGGSDGASAGHAGSSRTLLHQGAQSHMLRKVSDPQRKGSFALAVFLCFAQHSQFSVFRPVRVDGQFKLKALATVYAPEFDLIDFAVTPSGYLVALWTNPDGLPVLRYTCFNSDLGGVDSRTGWSNVVLEEPLDAEFSPPENTQYDPRQAYLYQIFYPGRFSIQTLAKTVSIYRRSLDLAGTLAEESISIAKLREEVCAAVETEIRNQITEYEITDEEHIAISHAAWSKFYSCAIQYHEAGLKPMGLVSDERTGLLSIVKKSGISFVRPVDALEHLVLTEGGVDANGPELFSDTPILCEDPALAQDVISLMRSVALVSSLVSPALADEFSHALQRLVSPDLIARKLVADILTDDNDGQLATVPNFTQALSTRLQQIGDVPRALEVLLMSLELDRGIVSHSDFSSSNNLESESDGTDRIFASPVGVSVLAESLNQMAVARFGLSRDLILLQLLMLQCNLPDGLSPNSAELIHSTYLPRSVVMAHSYFVLVWVTETTASKPPADSLEQGLRQMAVLKISEHHGAEGQHVTELAKNCQRPLTLSELFIMGPGRKARSLLTSDTRDQHSTWHSILMPLVNISGQLLWPRCAVPTFQEFLLSACQHMQIQEYVRLLSTWCDWNCQSRQFLLGSALLNMGEPEKACDWMVQAASGVKSDRFLTRQLFPNSEQIDVERLSVLYFLKVIQLFEQFGYYDCIIELAKTASAVCDDQDPDRTTLCYILFSYHLKLGHNDEAYDAMVSNPDQSRRKDSLRQFIVTLFDRRQLKQLAAYPYIDMFDDLETVIESRARSVDLTVNNYYEFLYSFHISKENYRKAAHVMYECGMRLGTEVFNLDGLKRQAKCYLACINALKLVNPSYAWIVKPVLQRSNSQEDNNAIKFRVSPKHSHDGEELANSSSSKPRLQVLEMSEIQKEFQLICARLKLANKSSDLTGPGLSPAETVALLVNANLFEDAVNLAKSFDLEPRHILEGLAGKCVRLARARPTEQEAAWEWLAEYSHSGTKGPTGQASMNDYRGGAGTAVAAAWSLLKSYVTSLEKRGQSNLHKSVVTKLMSIGACLPAWLVASYQMVNPAELLRLYLVHGYLQEASKLTCEYISAVLGNGQEYFGLTTSLHGSAPPVWLPHNLIDQLLLELREKSQDSAYHKLYMDVNRILENYLNHAAQVSQDMIEVRKMGTA